jgi:hypothetical protein
VQQVVSFLALINTGKGSKLLDKLARVALQFEVLILEVNLEAFLLRAQYHIFWSLSALDFLVAKFDSLSLHDLFCSENFGVL